MAYKAINFDELHEDLMEHQKTVEAIYLPESIKTDLDNIGADSMKREGKLIILTWKDADANEVKKKLTNGLKAHADKIKHIGTSKSGAGVKAEVEMN